MKVTLVIISLFVSLSIPAYSDDLPTFDHYWSNQQQAIVEIETHFSDLVNTSSKLTINKTESTKFWSIVYAIETHQGLNLFRPKNKSRSCNQTSSPCGHHQLSLQALEDIGCATNICKKNREDYSKSLAMSKKLELINQKRLKQSGLNNLPEYQRYLAHQQGANGLKSIVFASRGRKVLSKTAKRNMANNSPYSLQSLAKMSSEQAANKFLQHWQQKWNDQKDMIIIAQLDLRDIPPFTQTDLDIALNLRY